MRKILNVAVMAVMCAMLSGSAMAVLPRVLPSSRQVDAGDGKPPASRPPAVRIYLCERSVAEMFRVEDAWRDSHSRMPKKEPVYVSKTRTSTGLELYLPEYKLAVKYGEAMFFEATEARYRPTRETPARAMLGEVVETLTSAKELTDFTVTDDAMARLRQALDKRTGHHDMQRDPR